MRHRRFPATLPMILLTNRGPQAPSAAQFRIFSPGPRP